MVHSLLSRARDARRGRSDMPYLVIENALPEEYYKALEASFPATSVIAGSESLANNKAYRLSTRAALAAGEHEVTPIWQDFCAFHTSHEFFMELSDIWSSDISKHHRLWDDNFDKPIQNFDVGVRHTGKAADRAKCAT